MLSLSTTDTKISDSVLSGQKGPCSLHTSSTYCDLLTKKFSQENNHLTPNQWINNQFQAHSRHSFRSTYILLFKTKQIKRSYKQSPVFMSCWEVFLYICLYSVWKEIRVHNFIIQHVLRSSTAQVDYPWNSYVSAHSVVSKVNFAVFIRPHSTTLKKM